MVVGDLLILYILPGAALAVHAIGCASPPGVDAQIQRCTGQHGSIENIIEKLFRLDLAPHQIIDLPAQAHIIHVVTLIAFYQFGQIIVI